MKLIKSITVNVTKEVLDRSVKADSTKCMVAQALRLKGASSVNVTSDTISFNSGGVRYTFTTPESARAQIAKFDDKPAAVRPFRCVLQNPSMRPVIKRKQAKKRPTNKNKKREFKQCKRRYHGIRMIEAA